MKKKVAILFLIVMVSVVLVSGCAMPSGDSGDSGDGDSDGGDSDDSGDMEGDDSYQGGTISLTVPAFVELE